MSSVFLCGMCDWSIGTLCTFYDENTHPIEDVLGHKWTKKGWYLMSKTRSSFWIESKNWLSWSTSLWWEIISTKVTNQETCLFSDMLLWNQCGLWLTCELKTDKERISHLWLGKNNCSNEAADVTQFILGEVGIANGRRKRYLGSDSDGLDKFDDCCAIVVLIS